MAEGAALLQILTWLSPSFPTGGFAYSHALEWSVEAGDVGGEAALMAWIEDILWHGALWTDAILVRLAHQADADGLDELAAFGASLGASAERRLESLAQGAAFRAAAKPWCRGCLSRFDDAALPYPVAVGALAGLWGVAVADVVLAYLHTAVANLVSAGLRLIPLGQDAGLRVQSGLAASVLAVEAATAQAGPEDCGGCAWRGEIGAMRHETQYTRLFRT
ncbi:MAG: urease accessory UreF family protein [Acidocella sp.]|nr:urease accessory UreF family protein [Acidocella sp.]